MKIDMKIIGEKEGFDVSELAYEIDYSTSLKGYAGKLTFKLKKDPNDILKIALGDVVEFCYDDLQVFKGFIFTLSTTEEEEYSVVAYDQMRYLQNHDYYFTDGTMSASDIFLDICNKAGFKSINKTITEPFKVVNKSGTKVRPYTFQDKTYFEILEWAIQETQKGNYKIYKNAKGEEVIKYEIEETLSNTILDKLWRGFHYYIRDNFGVLEFKSLGSNLKLSVQDLKSTEQFMDNETLVIGEESLLMNYEYSIDIDKDTHNEIILMSETNESIKNEKDKKEKVKKLVYATQADSVNKWGRLRKIVTVKEGATEEQLKNYAKLILDVENNPTKTLKLTCLGYNGLYAGNAFALRLKSVGINDIPVYILSAVHHYNGDNHTMDLEVTTEGNFPEGL